MISEGTKYLFIIDTNQYSGNFEREMCAYLTGCIGDCGVGDKMSRLFYDEVDDPDDELFENIAYIPDEHGCSRPATIWRDSEDVYRSVGIWFETKPTPEQIQILKDRANKFTTIYKSESLKIKGFRLITFTTTSVTEIL